MDMNTALAIVADDVRQGYPDMTDAQAVEHAENTVSIDMLNIEPGVTLADDPNLEAYVIVLTEALVQRTAEATAKYISRLLDTRDTSALINLVGIPSDPDELLINRVLAAARKKL